MFLFLRISKGCWTQSAQKHSGPTAKFVGDRCLTPTSLLWQNNIQACVFLWGEMTKNKPRTIISCPRFICFCHRLLTGRLKQDKQKLSWKCMTRSFVALRSGKCIYWVMYDFRPPKRLPHVSRLLCLQHCVQQRALIWTRTAYGSFSLCVQTQNPLT